MKQIVGALALLVAVGELFAQEPAAVRKVTLPALDTQVAAKLARLDARLSMVHAENFAALLVPHYGSLVPLAGMAPIFADQGARVAWQQLPEEYHRLMLESGEALVPAAERVGGAGWPAIQVRRLCHARLASLPAASLAHYRQRIDAEAKALFEQGRQTHSSAPLRRLVDEFFCSSVTPQALDLLGDLAFERGDFADAWHWWGLLHGAGMRPPDAPIDPAQAKAKQILAMIFQGRLNDARDAITDFQNRHPHAAGHLAGRQGNYAQTLAKTLDSFQRERIANNSEPWTTFAGDPSRNRILAQGLHWRLWGEGPAWRVPLPALFPGPERSTLARRTAFHPIIVNEQVLIADHRSVISYHLATGKELFRYELNNIKPFLSDENRLPRFTLSSDGKRAYARLGRQGLGPVRNGAKLPSSYLVCLDLTEPHAVKNRELWRLEAKADAKSIRFFEGAPLVHEGQIYAALSTLTERTVATSIVCYDAQGKERWSREVCECPEFDGEAGAQRYQHHLLTLAAGQIVYCSHAGAVVAVDALTRQPTWGVRYPSRGPLMADHEPSPRDLAPCVYADGRVYLAPLDSDRLFCIDVNCGKIAWEADQIEILHLLGVTSRLAHAATPAGVQALDTATGRIEWSQPGGGRLPSLGRGVLAGGWLFWPTQYAESPCRALRLRTGSQDRDDEPSVLSEPDRFADRMPHVPAGNWAVGQSCLAIAGLNELYVYLPPELQPGRVPMSPRPDARLDWSRRDYVLARNNP